MCCPPRHSSIAYVSRVSAYLTHPLLTYSLQSQCLNQALRAERPDVDKKRSDLLKLQGEFRLKLRRLEKDLLAALNEAKGSLLDDDVIIAKMEKLKHEV